jgi:hypothetical protein
VSYDSEARSDEVQPPRNRFATAFSDVVDTTPCEKMSPRVLVETPTFSSL